MKKKDENHGDVVACLVTREEKESDTAKQKKTAGVILDGKKKWLFIVSVL